MDVFPVQTKQGSGEVQGVQTEVIVSSFTNTTYIAISQHGKFGSWMQVKSTIQDDQATISVKTLLAFRPEVEVFGKVLAQSLGLEVPLVVSVCIPELTPAAAKEAVNLVKSVMAS